jgi:hypothetical protein
VALASSQWVIGKDADATVVAARRRYGEFFT